MYRVDSISLEGASYTEEGYLLDEPVVSRVGIFEYRKPEGGVRRELRLPEQVFDKASLASYTGKPIILTHNAATVDKDNVADEQIGTILSEGFQDGDCVRAKIIIHDTKSLEESGMRELSLGYTLDLIEEAGEYEGQPYDAIQTNIRINHLAVVKRARMDNARLNIDGADEDIIYLLQTVNEKLDRLLEQSDKIEVKTCADEDELRQRVELMGLGERLNLDGLQDMGLNEAKKAVIRCIDPTIRLDNRDEGYIAACYDLLKQRKGFGLARSVEGGSEAARQRMIDEYLRACSESLF